MESIKSLEPNRPSRTDPEFIVRQGVSYQIDLEKVWIDVEALEKYITIGNQALYHEKEVAKTAYQNAIEFTKVLIYPTEFMKIGHPKKEKGHNC